VISQSRSARPDRSRINVVSAPPGWSTGLIASSRRLIDTRVAAYSVHRLRDYYEDLWKRLPEELVPPDFERRSRFLRAHLQTGERVLDLGCGAAPFSGLIGAKVGVGNVIGADVAEAALQRARQIEPEISFKRVPFDGPLPFADSEFALVWASEVIEHVADTGQWLSEVRRVLKPGGRLLITTPAHPRLRLLVGGIGRYSEPLGDHLHLYDRGSLSTLLAEFGFQPVQLKAVGPPCFARLLLAVATR
jgi:SAM-dependent methyltransferase